MYREHLFRIIRASEASWEEGDGDNLEECLGDPRLADNDWEMKRYGKRVAAKSH